MEITLYKDIWDAHSDISEVHIKRTKDQPVEVIYVLAVAVKKGELTIGHVSRFVSPICSIFN